MVMTSRSCGKVHNTTAFISTMATARQGLHTVTLPARTQSLLPAPRVTPYGVARYPGGDCDFDSIVGSAHHCPALCWQPLPRRVWRRAILLRCELSGFRG